MKSFRAKIFIIGVNPYVLLPEKILNYLVTEAGKDKGPIPVRVILNKTEFIQTLVKYSGKWRLYLNTPMRKSLGKDVGDTISVRIDFDSRSREIHLHPRLEEALLKNKIARTNFEKLIPSRKKEIKRYINSMKTEESLIRNIEKVIKHLEGKARFAGRD